MGTSTFENIVEKTNVSANEVHSTLAKKMLVDGFDFVLDIKRSRDLTLVDEKTGDEYLDFFSFFASSPLGMNHPKLDTPEFREELAIASLNKPSNSDIYTTQMANFVETFSRVAVPDFMKHLFFVDGGTLAVENGLKIAFDWKVRKNFIRGYKEERGQQVIHFREAFHGRSGYTMSLTNTDPVKIAHYPKFNWPRIINPKIKFPVEDNLNEIITLEEEAINEIYTAIKKNKDDIAVLIIEPVQAEGGDNFFRKEFHEKLREICSENEILLMYDEVQTGIGMTGKMWAYEHYVQPDIISFGKKVQICGVMVNDRIDDISENVFKKSSRINSTWGGNLTDMVRSRKNFEVIEEDNLIDNSRIMGNYLLQNINDLQNDFPEFVSRARGLGLMCAFDMPSVDIRKKFLAELYKNKLIMLGCGSSSVRFRTPLVVTQDEIDKGIGIIREVLNKM
ncbi:MAG: L-lysine 6-transaminase [Stygiobacter sp. RIFOXYC12_FULL_38_8]|nr:MAG: L-lysine 6-transaminase [Stygiobacter sp. GWC2_38_9]OGV09460.1 MAG: L-lysine 6-transaminase [Stygiobacter sp. RIFOXYB2_FULL_37_11]OGV11343.1 MAG: L-lysine 6-transaminase [Stygiobacter sp. RIFOXYA2_FULL_38_8]OGV15312.1 MAG: L-lysine 6-transaminase [Stygiobacter sp. RIFOXYC2_FULL_38_25]OGV30150.1 MAG: L-lysine 6-transaminase [Stygiobacter sp. RIFOXYC12_FULL_38_8]OGV79050.1 MAG: L-lysine 6-transaminase [Stygiobacter sp. GWF2_38_21]RJQ64351.1 MAG: L-lysine 6-transaminase [Stygiobacter sp.